MLILQVWGVETAPKNQRRLPLKNGTDASLDAKVQKIIFDLDPMASQAQ